MSILNLYIELNATSDLAEKIKIAKKIAAYKNMYLAISVGKLNRGVNYYALPNATAKKLDCYFMHWSNHNIDDALNLM